MDPHKLSEFIVALGRFDNYGSTQAETKHALESGTSHSLNPETRETDEIIFNGIKKAIENVVSKEEFGVESIISINRQFSGKGGIDPYHPGKLRWVDQDPRDNIIVPLWPGANGERVNYYPPSVIDEEDLEKIVQMFKSSAQTEVDAWVMFAQLSKLQPFQDGNKRTALLTANHALGAFKDENYLMPPVGSLYPKFMMSLMEYYGVGLEGSSYKQGEENVALKYFLELVPCRINNQIIDASKNYISHLNSETFEGATRENLKKVPHKNSFYERLESSKIKQQEKSTRVHSEEPEIKSRPKF